MKAYQHYLQAMLICLAFLIHGDRDGTKDSGYYFTDVVKLGQNTVQNFSVGLATTTADGPQVNNSGQGILGVSYRQDETAVDNGLQTTPTIYETMVDQGLIDRSAYSLYLDDAEIGIGSILFGGIDPGKYKGELVVLPLQHLNGAPPAFWVALTNISFSDGENTYPLTGDGFRGDLALLDSGTTLTKLPNEAFNNLIQGLGAVLGDRTEGNAVVPCSLRDDDKTSLYFQLGGADGPSMAVPLSAIIDSKVLGTVDGTNFCLLSVGPSLEGQTILGDSFLRSFYVVYDITNNQVAIATAVLNSTGTSSITNIPTGTSIPGATSTATFMLPTTTPNVTSTIAPVTSYAGPSSATFSLSAFSTSNIASTSTTARPSSNQASSRSTSGYGTLLGSLLCLFLVA